SDASTPLETCVNEILTSRNLSDENIYLINTDIRISHPVIYYETKYELRLFNKKPTLYVISGNITDTLQKLYITAKLNRNSLFIIMSNSFNVNIFQLLKYYFVNNAVSLTNIVNGTKIKNEIGFYKAMRLSHWSLDKCHKNNIYLVEISNNKKYHLKKLKVLYQSSPPYIINSTSGIYISIINIIAERLQIKVKYYKSNMSISAHKVSPEFLTRNFDLFVGPVYMASTEKYFYSKSVFITCDRSIYVFPKIVKQNYLMIIFQEFSLTLWCWLLLVITLIYFLFFVFEKLLLHQSKMPTYILLLSILLEGTAPVHIKNISCKILFTTFLIFTIIFTTLYKAKMFDIMKEGLSYNLYNSEEDILKYRLKIGVRDISILKLFNFSVHPFESAVYEQHLFEECGDYNNCLNITATKKNLVTAMILRYLQYVLPTYFLDDEGKSVFQVSYMPYLPIYHGIALLKDHPLTNSFNRYLGLLKEFGLVDYIQEKYEWKFQKAMTLAANTEGLISRSLSLKDFETIFLIYSFGIFVSLLTFFIELIIQKIKTT
ncbi:Ionotropic receptor 146, partial [Diabrotica virgifera virgifera]